MKKYNALVMVGLILSTIPAYSAWTCKEARLFGKPVVEKKEVATMLCGKENVIEYAEVKKVWTCIKPGLFGQPKVATFEAAQKLCGKENVKNLEKKGPAAPFNIVTHNEVKTGLRFLGVHVEIFELPHAPGAEPIMTYDVPYQSMAGGKIYKYEGKDINDMTYSISPKWPIEVVIYTKDKSKKLASITLPEPKIADKNSQFHWLYIWVKGDIDKGITIEKRGTVGARW